jgi:hypothetical protein
MGSAMGSAMRSLAESKRAMGSAMRSLAESKRAMGSASAHVQGGSTA